MTTRRLEYIAGTSCKFWEVSTSGNDITVRYGRIGTSGQSQTKACVSAVAAEQQADKQIAAKLAKGYRELAVA